MLIREIQEKDNQAVEHLIRTCLIEFEANKEGCAWSDPQLGVFSEVYQPENSCFWVVEMAGEIVAGCGIGPVESKPNVCELQKNVCFQRSQRNGNCQSITGNRARICQTVL